MQGEGQVFSLLSGAMCTHDGPIAQLTSTLSPLGQCELREELSRDMGAGRVGVPWRWREEKWQEVEEERWWPGGQPEMRMPGVLTWRYGGAGLGKGEVEATVGIHPLFCSVSRDKRLDIRGWRSHFCHSQHLDGAVSDLMRLVPFGAAGNQSPRGPVRCLPTHQAFPP